MSRNEEILVYRNKINEALKASLSGSVEFHVSTDNLSDSVSCSHNSTNDIEKHERSSQIISLRDESCVKPSLEKSVVTLTHLKKNMVELRKHVDNFNDSTCKISDSETDSDDCSSYSIISSDNSKIHEKYESSDKTLEELPAFKDVKDSKKPQSSSICQLGNSTRESFTQEWVKSVSVEDSNSLEANSGTKFNGEFYSLNSETEFEDCDSDDSSFDPEEISCCIIESIADRESSSSGSSFIVFSEALTEENCSTVLSESVMGSLNIEDELSSIEDEMIYSSSSGICSDWEDVVRQGSEQSYLNEGFIMEDIFETPARSKSLQEVNEKWEVSMADVEETPRHPVKISFAPSSTLVITHHYEQVEVEDPSYDFYILDRLHFQKRINDFNVLMSPFLTAEHRANVMLRNMLL